MGIKNDIEATQKLKQRAVNLTKSEIEFILFLFSESMIPGKKLIEAVGRKVPVEQIAAHFHDTYGQALSNIYAVLQMGVQTLDTSVAGLGGCPYAKGATGNVATEDVLYMLNGIGIKTGIKIEKIIEVSWYISNYMKRLPNSRVARAYVNQ